MISLLYKTRKTLCMLLCCCFALNACNKKEIQFGDNLADSFTRIIKIDTVTPFLSTVVLDSFPTSGNNLLLAGRYIDPYLGPTTARTFLQFELPAAAINAEIPEDAVYDSLVMVFHPNNEWYGDTSKPITFTAFQLEEQPEYSYAGKLWNTSSVTRNPLPLAGITTALSPSRDSLLFKIEGTRGAEMFDMIRQKQAVFQTEEAWLNYFKGITIQPNESDNGAVYSFKTDSTAVMRIHYHTTVPYFASHSINFYITRKDYQFNQVLTDRSGTALEKKQDGEDEFYPSEADPYAFTQAGTGVMLKIKFPGLQDIKTIGKTIRLLQATLVLKPVEESFDRNLFPLPSSLFMMQTNATNIIGDGIPDISGDGLLTAYPLIDDVYRINTSYSFDVTFYINYLLSLNNSSEMAMFAMEEIPGFAKKLNRTVIGSKLHPKYSSKLILTVLTTTE